MALCSRAVLEYRRFTLPNCLKKFSSDSITMLRKHLHKKGQQEARENLKPLLLPLSRCKAAEREASANDDGRKDR